MCGVFGIYGDGNAAYLTYLGLFALQHRGQESAGIITSDGSKIYVAAPAHPPMEKTNAVANTNRNNFFNFFPPLLNVINYRGKDDCIIRMLLQQLFQI